MLILKKMKMLILWEPYLFDTNPSALFDTDVKELETILDQIHLDEKGNKPNSLLMHYNIGQN